MRDIAEGEIRLPPVVGSSAIIFGATASAAVLGNYERDITAHALGLAGYVSPVNYQRAWTVHKPPSTLKYLAGGLIAQSAITAARLAKMGHTGDLHLLDDAEFGYPRFIGLTRWEPSTLTSDLGTSWAFPGSLTFKPFPSCRVLHPMMEALIDLLETHDLRPDEIETMRVWGEELAEEPVWRLDPIGHVSDSQTSVVHGLAVAAQRTPVGRGWQEPDLVFSREVSDLASRITFARHPDVVDMLIENPASRPARVEIAARGTTFSAERRYPRGTASDVPNSVLSTEELVSKFYSNAGGVVADRNAQKVVEMALNLQGVLDIRELTEHLRTD
jgi:2-methylcitrate dehydratase PrpD